MTKYAKTEFYKKVLILAQLSSKPVKMTHYQSKLNPLDSIQPIETNLTQFDH